MLFDLRGRGRRRTVRIIYSGLALLFLVGFVGFGVGVGGGGQGGLLNALTGNEGSGGAVYASQIKKYKKLIKEKPTDAAAWVSLTTAQLHEAGSEEYFSSATNQYTSKGKALLVEVASSWNSYLALNPEHPNPELAEKMLAVFGEEGLNQPAAAVQVLQIVIATKPPSEQRYAALAEYSYKAHNTREGDLAAAKAVSLAPAAQRKQLKTELELLKKNPNGSASEASSTPTGATTTGGGAATSTTTGTKVSTTAGKTVIKIPSNSAAHSPASKKK